MMPAEARGTSTNMGKSLRNRIGLIALASAVNLAGCATILEADSQTILMTVTPEDAQCFGWRNDQMVGIYHPLFQSMTVSKSTDELLITCNAYGYKTARLRLMPSLADWNVPEFNVVDYVTGGLIHYDGSVVIVMDKSDPVIGQSTPPN
jgi:hypothetical protein